MTSDAASDPGINSGGRQRIDRWLWCARFFKTRSLAAREVSAGHVRVNGSRVTKAAHAVKPGDVLTFRQASDIRVVAVKALAARRGPASEASALYEDRSPAMPPRSRLHPATNPHPDTAPDGRARARLRALKHTP